LRFLLQLCREAFEMEDKVHNQRLGYMYARLENFPQISLMEEDTFD
jgi:hypothetical protein